MIGELKKISKISFDELPDDIINLIFKTRYDIMKQNFKEKLIYRYIEDLNWGYTYNEKLNINIDLKHDDRGEGGGGAEWNWVIENFFSYGEQEDQKKFKKIKDITTRLRHGGEITKNKYTPDFRLWTAEEIKKFCFYFELEEKIIDKWEYSENFEGYIWENTEDINPYLSARDDDYEYGDYNINICLGNSHNQLYRHTNKAIYDALTDAANEWAKDRYDTSSGEGVGEPSRILNHIWDTSNIGSETDLKDCMETTALKLYGDNLECIEEDERYAVWGYAVYRFMRYNGISDMNGFNELSSEIKFYDG